MFIKSRLELIIRSQLLNFLLQKLNFLVLSQSCILWLLKRLLKLNYLILHWNLITHQLSRLKQHLLSSHRVSSLLTNQASYNLSRSLNLIKNWKLVLRHVSSKISNVLQLLLNLNMDLLQRSDLSLPLLLLLNLILLQSS